MKVFVDSDVVISSLISSKGAAYFLINQSHSELFVSDNSNAELEEVIKRLNLSKRKLQTLLKNKFKTIKLLDDHEKIKEEFKDYTLDLDDAHVVAGAKKANARFLISYNIRHYKEGKIRRDFNMIVLTPAKFLQYLRSIS